MLAPASALVQVVAVAVLTLVLWKLFSSSKQANSPAATAAEPATPTGSPATEQVGRDDAGGQTSEQPVSSSPKTANTGAGAGAGAGTGTSGESTVSGVPEQRLSLRVLYGTETNKAKGMWWLMHSHALFVGARALERSWCDSLHLPRCSTSARRAASAGSVCDECERRSLRCLCRQHGRLRPGVTLLWCACVLLVARPHMIGCGCGYGYVVRFDVIWCDMITLPHDRTTLNKRTFLLFCCPRGPVVSPPPLPLRSLPGCAIWRWTSACRDPFWAASNSQRLAWATASTTRTFARLQRQWIGILRSSAPRDSCRT